MKMKNQTIRQFATVLIAAALLIGPLSSSAELHSNSKEIVVLEPQDLPEQAQHISESLFLHADNGGSTFLYLEQKEGARLVVLDVTDPARIKSVSAIPLEARGAFDFVEALNDHGELIRYRRNGGIAVLDLTKAKKPMLHTVTSEAGFVTTESVGRSGFLATSGPHREVNLTAQDFQLIDLSGRSGPAVLTTIKQVNHRVTNDETGTTFLLGGDGLTVVRQPSVEGEYQEHQRQLDHN
jgi:hypothetical protein